MIKSEYIQEAFTKISDEKKQRILDVALIEFAEYGYESANINVIAEKAEISVGAMYKYFGNKENLYLTIVQVCIKKLNEVIEEIVEDDGEFIEIIERIILAIQSYSSTYDYLTKFYNQMTTERHSELVWKIVSDMESVTDRLYAPFIVEAQRKGQVRKNVNPRFFSFFLDNLFMLLQFSYSCEYYKERLKMYVGEDIFDRDEIVLEQLMSFIKGALFLDDEGVVEGT